MHCIVAAIALALVCGVAANTSAAVADAAIYPGDRAPGTDPVQVVHQRCKARHNLAIRV
jgi:hypothetical protein